MEAKEILHHYIGCEVYDTFNDCKLILTPKAYAGYMEHWDKPEDGQIKLLLTDVNDITSEDLTIIETINGFYAAKSFKDRTIGDAKITSYLIKRGYDVFGLIEKGNAIDKTKVK